MEVLRFQGPSLHRNVSHEGREVEDIQVFEPREFLTAGENVTVLGWERTQAKFGGRLFETEWVHVFTVREGRIVRFWGMYDTEASAAARA
jgi:ketosteroid isomerase-like protein